MVDRGKLAPTAEYLKDLKKYNEMNKLLNKTNIKELVDPVGSAAIHANAHADYKPLVSNAVVKKERQPLYVAPKKPRAKVHVSVDRGFYVSKNAAPVIKQEDQVKFIKVGKNSEPPSGQKF